MANKFRREVKVKLDGREYTLRPSFEAMCDFEDKAETTAFVVMGKLKKGEGAPLKTVAAALWAGIRHSGDYKENILSAPSFVEVGEMVQSEGYPGLVTTLMEFLIQSSQSDEALRKRADDAAGKAISPTEKTQ
jgi:hypothetical protein